MQLILCIIQVLPILIIVFLICTSIFYKFDSRRVLNLKYKGQERVWSNRKLLRRRRCASVVVDEVTKEMQV